MAEQQYVIFKLSGQSYGAPIDVVREVNYLTPITHLPNTPDYVEGVINLRGEVLPVVDMRKRLGMPPEEADRDARLMVLNLGARSAALLVDGVEQVQTLRDEEIFPPDAHVTVAGQDYVSGVARTAERLIILLDLGRLMG